MYPSLSRTTKGCAVNYCPFSPPPLTFLFNEMFCFLLSKAQARPRTFLIWRRPNPALSSGLFLMFHRKQLDPLSPVPVQSVDTPLFYKRKNSPPELQDPFIRDPLLSSDFLVFEDETFPPIPSCYFLRSRDCTG